jgi:hypothetical protein
MYIYVDGTELKKFNNALKLEQNEKHSSGGKIRVIFTALHCKALFNTVPVCILARVALAYIHMY